jgi:hypothetical protein
MKTSAGWRSRKKQWSATSWSTLFLGLLSQGIQPVAASAQDVTMSAIQAAWQSREKKLNSIPFRFEWAENRFDSGGTKGPIATEYKTVMIAKGKKLRSEWSRLGSRPLKSTFVWQGKRAKVLDDDGSAAKNGAIWDTHKRFVDFPIRAASLALWPTNAGFTEVDLNEYRLQPGSRTINGTSCCMLTKKNNSSIETELYLNIATGFLIQRIVGKEGDRIARQVDYEYTSVDKIGWMPRSWGIVIMKSGSNEIAFRLLASDGKVTVIEEPADSTFDIVFPVGTRVRTSDGEKVERFVVDQHGNQP